MLVALSPVRRPLCRHCRTKHVSRPRGLCSGCYYQPGVPQQYPSTSIYARIGIHARRTGVQSVPTEPTEAEPGSEEKIQILEARAERGERLHHPDDRRIAHATLDCEPGWLVYAMAALSRKQLAE